MQPNTSDKQFSEQTVRQVAADARRALVRGRYSPESSQIERLRCVDDQPETEREFGHQLWFFDGFGVDELNRRVRIFGAIEYSLQFGLHELVEDGVFSDDGQRNRFRHVYRGHAPQPTWRHAAHGWLAAGMAVVTAIFLAYLALTQLFPV